jgi:hypothetical protein
MFWQCVLAILAGWMVLPALGWALAHQVLRYVRSEQGLTGRVIEWLSALTTRL